MNYTKHSTPELVNIRKSLEGNLGNNLNSKKLKEKLHIINGIIEVREKEFLDNLEKENGNGNDAQGNDFKFNFDYQCAKKFVTKFHDSKKRGISFDLSLEKFKKLMKTKRCYYTGIRLTDTIKNKTLPNYRTFDRIDCNKGYTDKNTVVCTNKVNQIKNMLFETQNDNFSLTVKQAQLFLDKLKND